MSDDTAKETGSGENAGESPSGEGSAGSQRATDVRRDDGPLGDAMADLLGRILRRGRAEIEKAARRGRDRLALRQMRSDRDRMYQKLGKEARHLLEAGEIDHPGLRKGVERVRELEARLLEQEDLLKSRGEAVEEEAPEGAGEASEGGTETR
jgi:hypothetical protein